MVAIFDAAAAVAAPAFPSTCIFVYVRSLKIPNSSFCHEFFFSAYAPQLFRLLLIIFLWLMLFASLLFAPFIAFNIVNPLYMHKRFALFARVCVYSFIAGRLCQYIQALFFCFKYEVMPILPPLCHAIY